MSAVVPSFDEDLFSTAAILEPYGVYRRLRDLGAVVRLEASEVFAIGRYAEVRAVLGDHERFRSGEGVALNEVANQAMRGTTLASDPPAHEALRSVVAQRLTPRALRERAHDIEAVARRLVDELVERGSFDAVPDLAQAMPMTVVPDFVGWPQHGRDKLLTWAGAAIDSVGPRNGRTEAALPLADELAAYAVALATDRDLLPGSVGAGLLDAADRGEIHHDQCPALMIDYLGPSIETTASAIGAAIALFARHPGQWDLIRADPRRIPHAFNEVVRYSSPLRGFARVSADDTDVGGTVIPAGGRVFVLFASANRDERKWDRPDTFDITRDATDHLAFGYGIHGCAGQGLARLETHAVLAALADRVARIESDGEPVYAVNNVLRAYSSVPVTVRAA